MKGTLRGLEGRIEALERHILAPSRALRVILVWRDDEGRLTKWTDSHPHLPDDRVYQEDLSLAYRDLPRRKSG